MTLAAKIRRAPVRLASGSFILNSGLSKLKADEATAAGLHAMAVAAYPFLKRVPATAFIKALAVTEIGVGAALLLPIVPAGLAGIALTGFAGGLVGLYVRTPALHDKYLRPTQAGTAIAKDAWLAGIGVSLVVDAALSEASKTIKTDG